jgi:diguanylate cyclase (GGDEF)-like protein
MTGERAGEIISLHNRAELTIGRSPSAGFRIQDTAISRVHCRIVHRDDTFYIEDLNSANGTMVNGEPAENVELRVGDRIQLGPNIVFQFGISDDTEDTLARRLYYASTRDPLTGTFNRHFLFERVASEISHAQRHKNSLSLMLIDIDHFKQVNDTFGHMVGDAVLREVARAMSVAIRSDDALARYGGEEFAILVKASSREETLLFAERLRERVASLRVLGGNTPMKVTVSIGVAELSECEDGDSSAEALFRIADQRLYKAKNSGRDRVCGD